MSSIGRPLDLSMIRATGLDMYCANFLRAKVCDPLARPFPCAGASAESQELTPSMDGSSLVATLKLLQFPPLCPIDKKSILIDNPTEINPTYVNTEQHHVNT